MKTKIGRIDSKLVLFGVRKLVEKLLKMLVKLTTGVISWENTTRDELRDSHYRIKSGEKVTVLEMATKLCTSFDLIRVI
jgi:hypothetical protein